MLPIVFPGTGISPVRRQSCSTPPGYAVSPGVSCCIGVITTSRRTPRCVFAIRLKARAMVWKASKSERASHGGSMAGLKAWMNGCISVDDRSDFSYQVAAGSTRSDSNVVDVIRKSIDIIRSSLPSGMVCSQAMSRGRSSGTVGSARTLPVVPSRCLRKYSLPLLDEPSRFARQAVSTRGQFRSASGSVTASFSSPEAS